MPIKIFTLPASSGKTTWVVNQIRQAGPAIKTPPWVILPSRQQVGDFGVRLANAGGAIGVKIGTINDLAREVLEMGRIYPLLLPESVQLEVLRSILPELDLVYFKEIKSKPGFARVCLNITQELEAGGIEPDEFLNAAKGIRRGPRLIELGLVYSAYLGKLRENGWADQAGLIWQAAVTLAQKPELCKEWGEVYLDGFDDLTPVQIQLITRLSERVGAFYLTITGSPVGNRRELVHKRFLRLRELLEIGKVEDLKNSNFDPNDPANPATYLERALFENKDQDVREIGEDLHLAAVPDREAEVRTALRWIRRKIIEEEIPPQKTAILARNLEPYRGLIYRIAGEYALPVRLQGGVSLAENPLVATIMKLARLISLGKEGLVWHEVLSIWRSPYLNWSRITNCSEVEDSRAAQLTAAKPLEEIARWGRVIQGYPQWEETFRLLITMEEDQDTGDKTEPDGLPRGKRAEQLWNRFTEFADLIVPPSELTSRENYIAWMEGLLGGLDPNELPGEGFGVVEEVLASPADLVARDWQALASLNSIFREQIWAERLLDSPPVDFAQFLWELEEAVNKSSFQPLAGNEDAIVCAGCTEARGLSFKAVAVLGLAEGEFPRTIKEDPFMRDEERALLREQFGLPLRLSVDSAEAEYFYEALTRSTRSLLLTRPRIAENGASWQPSPFWEEVQRVTRIEPEHYTTRSVYSPGLAATQAELLQRIAVKGRIPQELIENSDEKILSQLRKLERTREIILERVSSSETGSRVHDGNLERRSESISARYPEDHVWSASRLENYQACPFYYFIGNLLGLEQLKPPEEGLDARQRGNIYHHILEKLYQLVGREYSVEDLLERLPEATEPIFQDAPQKEGFRETAWWEHTQREIIENLKLNLVCLEEIDPGYRFYAAEQKFGLPPGEEEPLCVVIPNQGAFLLHGLIDRVDINEQGGIRIVDYKTSGAAGFNNRAVREGIKLQLPLYALAAQERLELGPVKEGFYFHLLGAKPSSFKLSSYKEGASRGPELAMKRAAEAGWQAVSSIRKGRFLPEPPENGCPDYCPAVDFCWHYRARKW
ncbi:MAG: hypothetical protein DRI46_09895 [Chloroflexi bacterium]|nr:MAG: hypothetical protein DRI46_09895 [Chloroflexota bacterium]